MNKKGIVEIILIISIIIIVSILILTNIGNKSEAPEKIRMVRIKYHNFSEVKSVELDYFSSDWSMYHGCLSLKTGDITISTPIFYMEEFYKEPEIKAEKE